MLDVIAREIAALSRRDRSSILAALAPAERERLRAAMRHGESDAPARAGIAADGRSAWMRHLIAAAGAGSDATITPAAAEALLSVVDERVEAVARPSGRSLLQTATGLFTPARAR